MERILTRNGSGVLLCDGESTVEIEYHATMRFSSAYKKASYEIKPIYGEINMDADDLKIRDSDGSEYPIIITRYHNGRYFAESNGQIPI